MVMVQLPVYISLDDISLLAEIKSRYHLKNNSEAIRLIIVQWRKIMSDKEKALQQTKESSKKPVNPMVNP